MSNNTLFETEIKLYAPDLDAVTARLKAAGATLETPRVFERNVRYDDARGSFTGRGIVLRLREDMRVRLTYKDVPSGQDGIISRFEAEVTVDSFDKMDLILRQLGYLPFAIYEKYRTTYRFSGAEVVLDELPYGNFVEIEGNAEAIKTALAALELDGAPRMATSYLGLFTQMKTALQLDFDDLTFANFQRVTVPADYFDE